MFFFILYGIFFYYLLYFLYIVYIDKFYWNDDEMNECFCVDEWEVRIFIYKWMKFLCFCIGEGDYG